MTITFADGTHVEVAASAFKDFIKYDLKWVEFVHGRASENHFSRNPKPQSADLLRKIVHRCPSRPAE
jgi:hypothetical protein